MLNGAANWNITPTEVTANRFNALRLDLNITSSEKPRLCPQELSSRRTFR